MKVQFFFAKMKIKGPTVSRKEKTVQICYFLRVQFERRKKLPVPSGIPPKL